MAPKASRFPRTSGSSQLANYSRLAALIGGGGSANFFGGVDMAVHMGLNNVLGFKGMFGQAANEWTDRPNARNYLVWGNNPAETSMTSMRFLLDARAAGTEIIVIDSRYSATAMHATWWIAPRPGTDLALALGMLHVLIDEQLIDESFAIAHTVGPLLVRKDNGRFLRESDVSATGSSNGYLVLDAVGTPGNFSAVSAPRLRGHFEVGGHAVTTAFTLLTELVAGYPPDRVADITGVAAGEIRELARSYANGPSTIGFGYGVDRYPARRGAHSRRRHHGGTHRQHRQAGQRSRRAKPRHRQPHGRARPHAAATGLGRDRVDSQYRSRFPGPAGARPVLPGRLAEPAHGAHGARPRIPPEAWSSW